MEDICGSTDTTTGEPCQNKAESCPWHDTDSEPNSRQTALENNPDLIDRVSDRLAAGDTVAEACAEVVEVSERQYYEWRRRADEEGGLFREFREETTRLAEKTEPNLSKPFVKPRIRERGTNYT